MFSAWFKVILVCLQHCQLQWSVKNHWWFPRPPSLKERCEGRALKVSKTMSPYRNYECELIFVFGSYIWESTQSIAFTPCKTCMTYISAVFQWHAFDILQCCAWCTCTSKWHRHCCLKLLKLTADVFVACSKRAGANIVGDSILSFRYSLVCEFVLVLHYSGSCWQLTGSLNPGCLSHACCNYCFDQRAHTMQVFEFA